jgi:hypothetical protein
MNLITKFDIYEHVYTPFHQEGIVVAIIYEAAEMRYLVRTSIDEKWWPESLLVLAEA